MQVSQARADLLWAGDGGDSSSVFTQAPGTARLGTRPYHMVLQTRELALSHVQLTGSLDRTGKPPWAHTGQTSWKLLQHPPYWPRTGTKFHVPFWGVLVFFLPSYAKKFPSVLQDVPTTFPVLAITYKVRWIHSKMYMAWREFYVLLRGLLAFPTVKHFEICGWKNPVLYRTMKVLTPSGINPTALGRPEIIIVFQLRKETASCVELWVLSVLFLPSEEELSCSVCMKKCNGTLQWVT